MLRIESPQRFLWGEPQIGADNSAITGTVPPKGTLITYQASSQAIRGIEEKMLPTTYDVTNKVVFIMGAGHGIGKGMAQGLAAAGADVVLNALTSRHAEHIAAEPGRRCSCTAD